MSNIDYLIVKNHCRFLCEKIFFFSPNDGLIATTITRKEPYSEIASNNYFYLDDKLACAKRNVILIVIQGYSIFYEKVTQGQIRGRLVEQWYLLGVFP